MTFKSLLLAAIPAAAFATTAGAATISTTLPITSDGESFTLSESTSAYDPYFGGGATLTIILNGDFSSNTSTEYADITIDTLGTLRLGYDGADHVVSNTASEISLISSTFTETVSYSDAILTYVFSVTDLGMAFAFDDNLLEASIDLSSSVNFYESYDADYITMTLDYTSLPAVPLPASAPLLLAALAGVGAMKRRKAK